MRPASRLGAAEKIIHWLAGAQLRRSGPVLDTLIRRVHSAATLHQLWHQSELDETLEAKQKQGRQMRRI